MKYQKKQEWKRKVFALIALAMAMVMVLSLLAPFITFAEVMAEPTTQMRQTEEEDTSNLQTMGTDRMKCQLTAGFGEAYIIGNTLPVQGSITNLGDGFEGELRIKAYLRTTNNTAEYTVYYQPVTMETGATLPVDAEITMGDVHKYVEVSMVDTKGTEIFREYLFLTAKDPATKMVGVLSENKDDTAYLAGLHLALPEDESDAYGEEISKMYDYTVMLDEYSFPATGGLMESFTVILIEDFDTQKLSEEQKQALNDWVKLGGTLVLGTGVNANKVLGGLDMVSDISVSATEPTRGVLGFEQETTVATLAGEGLIPFQSEGARTLSFVKKVGAGSVLILPMALSQAPIARRTETLELLMDNIRGLAGESLRATMNSVENYRLSNVAHQFPAMEMQSFHLILGMVVVYIVLVGPVLYFILKKKDRREQAWIVIPALSLLFMGLVFLMAQSSGYKNGMLRTIAYVPMDANATMVAGEVGVGLKSADKGDVTFRTEEDITILPKQEDWYYSYSSLPDVRNDMAYRIKMGEGAEITFVDNSSWETQFFGFTTAFDMGGNVTSNIKMDGSRIFGEIINGTNVDFCDVVLVIDGSRLYFDEMKAGTKLPVDIDIDRLFNEDEYTGMAYYDLQSKVQDGEMSRKEAFLKSNEEEMVDSYSDYTYSAGFIPIEFFGFSEASALKEDYRVNGKALTESSLTMYHQIFPLDLNDMDSFMIEVMGESMSGEGKYEIYYEGDQEALYAYEDMNAEVLYYVPQGVRIKNILIAEDKGLTEVQLFREMEQDWVGVPLNVDIPAGDYVTAEGTVRLGLKLEGGIKAAVPRLQVKGGGTHAGN